MSATRPPAFDDRFTTPIEASRRGAHRARPKAVSAGLPVLAGLAVVLVVLGGAYVVLGGGSSSDSSGTVAGASTGGAKSTPKAGSGSTPQATHTKAQTQSQPSPSSASDGTGTTGTTGGSDGNVDHSISLIVLNSGPIHNLAKKVMARIEPDGWNVQRTGNSKNRNLVTTKIYYGKPSTKATADALLKDIGYGIVVQDTEVAPDGLVVVLGQDAAGA